MLGFERKEEEEREREETFLATSSRSLEGQANESVRTLLPLDRLDMTLEHFQECEKEKKDGI